ncbi:MAG: hypothetical protein EOP22_15195 [Hyphomicrobiales bacterium]|nr:MAG: hypothetical protein EOP22_15195 [Hyphomicrobiales bacterium]
MPSKPPPKWLFGAAATYKYGLSHGLASRLLAPIDRWQARRGQRHLKRFVGITGSVGKSTATMLAGALLKAQFRTITGVYLNAGRHPLRRVRKLREPTDYVVQELSGHMQGALDNVLDALRIDVAVVTAVGLDHAAAFRSVDAVAAEKQRLVAAVPPEGVACLNADDPLVRGMAAVARCRVVLYGTAPDAELRAANLDASWPNRLSFDLIVGDVTRRVRTRFAGRITLPSILAALAVVHATGADLDRAIDTLASIEPLPNRLAPAAGPFGHDYLRDTYKASLWSTRALIDDMASWGPVPRILVLGDLSDTGNDGSRKYRGALRVAAANCALVIGVGLAAGQARRLAAAGEPNLAAASSLDEVRDLLRARPPSLVILKSNSKYPLDLLLEAQP